MGLKVDRQRPRQERQSNDSEFSPERKDAPLVFDRSLGATEARRSGLFLVGRVVAWRVGPAGVGSEGMGSRGGELERQCERSTSASWTHASA